MQQQLIWDEREREREGGRNLASEDILLYLALIALHKIPPSFLFISLLLSWTRLLACWPPTDAKLRLFFPSCAVLTISSLLVSGNVSLRNYPPWKNALLTPPPCPAPPPPPATSDFFFCLCLLLSTYHELPRVVMVVYSWVAGGYFVCSFKNYHCPLSQVLCYRRHAMKQMLDMWGMGLRI